MSNRLALYKKGAYGSKRTAKKFAAQYYKNASTRTQQAIDARRGFMGLPPIATRGFGDMSYRANRERKYYDLVTNANTVADAGVFRLIHIPKLGSDYDDRIGRKTIARSIYIRGSIRIKAATSIPEGPVTLPCQMCRMILFVDNQPNGNVPTTADLLVENEPDSHLNPNLS